MRKQKLTRKTKVIFRFWDLGRDLLSWIELMRTIKTGVKLSDDNYSLQRDSFTEKQRHFVLYNTFYKKISADLNISS